MRSSYDCTVNPERIAQVVHSVITNKLQQKKKTTKAKPTTVTCAVLMLYYISAFEFSIIHTAQTGLRPWLQVPRGIFGREPEKEKSERLNKMTIYLLNVQPSGEEQAVWRTGQNS